MQGVGAGYELNISWSEPAETERRGVIIEYNVYNKKDVDFEFGPPFIWEVSRHHVPSVFTSVDESL